MEIITLKENYDDIAPDGSEIRLLSAITKGGMSHCTLHVGKISRAVKHKSVEEIWYFLEGDGELWRKTSKTECVVKMEPNSTITIPVGCHFQFRNIGCVPLRFLILTMPPWPGVDEATLVENFWK